MASKQAAARLQSVSSDSNSWSMAPLSPGLTIPGVSPDSFRDQLEGAQARGVLVYVLDHLHLVGPGFLPADLDALAPALVRAADRARPPLHPLLLFPRLPIAFSFPLPPTRLNSRHSLASLMPSSSCPNIRN